MKDKSDVQISFVRMLTKVMLENQTEIIPHLVESPIKTQNRSRPIVHELKKHPKYTGVKNKMILIMSNCTLCYSILYDLLLEP